MYLGAVRSGAYGHKTGDGAVIGTVQLAIRTFTEPTRGASPSSEDASSSKEHANCNSSARCNALMAAVRERGASPPRALPLEVGPVAELADALSALEGPGALPGEVRVPDML